MRERGRGVVAGVRVREIWGAREKEAERGAEQLREKEILPASPTKPDPPRHRRPRCFVVYKRDSDLHLVIWWFNRQGTCFLT